MQGIDFARHCDIANRILVRGLPNPDFGVLVSLGANANTKTLIELKMGASDRPFQLLGCLKEIPHDQD
ncbi:MAG TPA: hypothetical protein VGB94_03270, partial [Acidobacteriaceae bacterium]